MTDRRRAQISSRKQPKQARSTELVAAVLEAAVQVLAKEGAQRFTTTRVAEKAKAAGVNVEMEVWPEMVHVWHVYAKILPEGQQAIDRIGQYVQQHTA